MLWICLEQGAPKAAPGKNIASNSSELPESIARPTDFCPFVWKRAALVYSRTTLLLAAKHSGSHIPHKGCSPHELVHSHRDQKGTPLMQKVTPAVLKNLLCLGNILFEIPRVPVRRGWRKPDLRETANSSLHCQPII